MSKIDTVLQEALAEVDVPEAYRHAIIDAYNRRAALSAKTEAQPVANEVNLPLIRKWPDGFEKRLQAVWLDVVSFIPNVKLYDLQRVLSEFGFTLKVYEGQAPLPQQESQLLEAAEKALRAARKRVVDARPALTLSRKSTVVAYLSDLNGIDVALAAIAASKGGAP